MLFQNDDNNNEKGTSISEPRQQRKGVTLTEQFLSCTREDGDGPWAIVPIRQIVRVSFFI
jgi:hypothetical protein